LKDAEVALIAYGFTARSALYAVKNLRKDRMKVGMLRLKTLCRSLRMRSETWARQ